MLVITVKYAVLQLKMYCTGNRKTQNSQAFKLNTVKQLQLSLLHKENGKRLSIKI